MSEPLTGEERLFAAVLMRAVLDNDCDWIEADDPLDSSEDHFTFIQCCRALGLDEHAYRGIFLDPDRRGAALQGAYTWTASQGQRTTGRQVGRCVA